MDQGFDIPETSDDACGDTGLVCHGSGKDCHPPVVTGLAHSGDARNRSGPVDRVVRSLIIVHDQRGAQIVGGDRDEAMTLLRDPFTAGLGEQTGPTHWPSLLPDEAGPAWAELRDWVEQLVDRFALETRIVPPCWYRHSTLVEALSALRDHERICFAPTASPSGAVDWFRALREIENRLSQACARTQCSINEHRPDTPRAWTADQGRWQAFSDTDIADREQRVIDESLADR